jgi:hypothetical protein
VYSVVLLPASFGPPSTDPVSETLVCPSSGVKPSYEQTERFVCDSIVLRQFCRLYLEPAPDDTTLIRWANQIGPGTVASLNDRAVENWRAL